jgi:hypothetical protein
MAAPDRLDSSLPAQEERESELEHQRNDDQRDDDGPDDDWDLEMARGLRVAVAAVVVLPPFQLWLLAEPHCAWLAVAILLLLAANYRELKRSLPGTPVNH